MKKIFNSIFSFLAIPFSGGRKELNGASSNIWITKHEYHELLKKLYNNLDQNSNVSRDTILLIKRFKRKYKIDTPFSSQDFGNSADAYRILGFINSSKNAVSSEIQIREGHINHLENLEEEDTVKYDCMTFKRANDKQQADIDAHLELEYEASINELRKDKAPIIIEGLQKEKEILKEKKDIQEARIEQIERKQYLTDFETKNYRTNLVATRRGQAMREVEKHPENAPMQLKQLQIDTNDIIAQKNGVEHFSNPNKS